MRALERPSEVVLVAFFDAAGAAEAAGRAFLHSGLGADHVALLAREFRGAAMTAVPHSTSLRLPGVGKAVARGALAVELGRVPQVGGAEEQLGAALRRLGLSLSDVPRIARALQKDQILLLAAVPREEALAWGRRLQGAGAASLTARARLERWPSTPTAAVSRPIVGRRRGTTAAVSPPRPEPRRRSVGTRWTGVVS